MVRPLVSVLAAFWLLLGNSHAEPVINFETLLRDAAEGIAAAQTELASHYLTGEGVERDPAAAMRWYEKAAEQGHPLAQTILGWLYMGGAGIATDYENAALWLGRAALQGSPEAQLSLGTLYARGEGVPQNFIDSYMWLGIAAANLPPGKKRDEANAWRLSVSRYMSPEQMEEADRLAESMTGIGRF